MYQKSLAAMLRRQKRNPIRCYEVIDGYMWISDGYMVIRTLPIPDEPSNDVIRALGLPDDITATQAVSNILRGEYEKVQKQTFYTDKYAFFGTESKLEIVDIKLLKICEADKNIEYWQRSPAVGYKWGPLVAFDELGDPVRVLLPARIGDEQITEAISFLRLLLNVKADAQC